MKVVKIKAACPEAQDIPGLLDDALVDFHSINTVNWKEYPYCPEVAFRIAHTGNAILLHYCVTENSVRARYADDNGSVWTDSCVEFFSIPDADGIYYNLECNCIGTVLLAAGTGREHREHALPEVTARIKRWATLGRKPFEERVGECTWEVALWIPCEVFFRHHIDSLDGCVISANFYKCGDELSTPHFLSWSPIAIERPDFHRPDFFGKLEFE